MPIPETEDESVPILSPYFCKTRKVNVGGKLIQYPLRDPLGWAGSFSFCVIGGADPNGPCFRNLPAELFPANPANDQAAVRILRIIVFSSRGVMSAAALKFSLNCRVVFHTDNGLMGVAGMILRQLSVIQPGSF